MKVFIFGAGMSGISTGLNLLINGVKDVQIFELEKEAGGLSSSFPWGEFEYNDHGPHIWHTPNNDLAQEWEAKFSDLLFKGNFRGANVIEPFPGELLNYPISRSTIETFEPSLKNLILAELASCKEESKISATSFDEYVNALVGPTLTRMFFKDYPEKLWGISTSEMTANWAPKRITFTEKPGNFHHGQWSAVGKKGSGELIKILLDEYLKLGGKINYKSKLTAIETSSNKVKSFEINGNQVNRINASDRIVSTIPFNEFSNLLGIKNNLSYRGAHLVYVSLNKKMCIPGEYSFLYFPQPDISFHRLSEQKKFCDFGWPSNRTTVVAEIAYTDGESNTIKRDAVISKVIKDLIKTKLITSQSEILDTLCLSFPCVYPMLTREKEIEFNNVLSKIRNFDQINVIGTGGEYHYADLQILYVKGRDLAKRIISEYNSTNTFVSKKVVDNKEIPIVPAKYFPAKPFVIAEIGLNHGGNIEIAKKLLIEAKRVGVKFAKFQAYKTESRISAAYRANNYFEEVVGTEENLFQMFKKCELSFEDFRILFDFASEIRINMFSAVFDIESLKMLEDLKCPAYKIASMDVNNTPLLKEVAKTKKPIILSTGMSSLGEIEKAVNILSGSDSQELIILHCVSSYPASFDSLNLKSIHTLQSAFDHSVGFSDHSVGIIAPIVAVSIGATAIEKHFTLNKSMEGPDHIFSLEPKEMGELVEIIDNIPKILGSSFKKVFRQELDTAFKFKKSIHAKSFIRKGEYFSEVNLEIKGPGEGLSPELWDELIGRSSKSDILPDHPITWRDI